MSRTRDPQPISPLVSLAATSSTWLLLIIQQHPSLAAELSTPKPTFEPRGITPQDTLVFIIGTIPFGIATWQFWTRIAKGQRFGTGKDSVVIDTGRMDWKKQDEESKADEGEIKTENKTKGAARTLSKDAIQVAYILMMAALFAYGLVFASGYDVLTRK